MLFNSLLFILFFIVTSCLYYFLPHRFRWFLLLITSCYFYMYFKPVYVLIIFATIIIDYCAGILIEKSNGSKRRILLIVSLAANIGILAFFKYFNFIADNINHLLPGNNAHNIPFVTFILPIGLSFHTFQAMSYTIEVYRGNQKAEQHFGIYSLYVMFYPQMVAGPIERPQHILPQFHRIVQFSKTNLATGLLLISIGMIKKVVIADRLALYVDPVFNHPSIHSPLDLLIAAYLFAFQIYCDFSGYSDIAIGAAMVLGIELMKNFNAPYLALNISDFWKKWHISLSTWFRDYLYIPLGGNRHGFLKTCINLFVVFLISGLWHGADWKYVLWGVIHGSFLIIYQLTKKIRVKIIDQKLPQWFFTFNIVALAWIFFRANHVNDGFYILKKIFSFSGWDFKAASVMNINEILYCILMIIVLLVSEKYFQIGKIVSNHKKILLAGGLVIICYFLGIFNEAQFIYFQF